MIQSLRRRLSSHRSLWWVLGPLALLLQIAWAWSLRPLPLADVYAHCASSSLALTSLRLGNYLSQPAQVNTKGYRVDAFGELDAPFIFGQGGDVLVACGLLQGPLPALLVDIGANLGETSAAMAELCRTASLPCRIHAFEPAPATFDKLRERARAAHWAGYTVTRAAVSSAAGVQNFYFGLPGDEQSSLSRSSAGEWKEAVLVNITTVDALTAQLAPSAGPAFLKIDAEGFDAHVLAGASATLQQRRFPFVLFEYNMKWRDAPGGPPQNSLGRVLPPLNEAGCA